MAILTWTFWTQFLITSVGGGAISAAVGYIVVRVVRRYVGPVLEGQKQIAAGQEEIKATATTAADSAGAAATHSRRAEVSAVRADGSAAMAGENSRLANEALLAMNAVIQDQAATIRDLTDGNDDMADRIDRLLGTRARQLAQERLATATGALLIPRTAAEPDEAATVTGRHSLHLPHLDDGDLE